MMRHRFSEITSLLALDAAAALPLIRQLYDGFRAAILRRQLAGGARLPSTRALARDLGVSRNTVTGAYQQLLAEGYFEARRGSGTFVSSVLPDALNQTGSRQRSEKTLLSDTPALSRSAALLIAALPNAGGFNAGNPGPVRPFLAGVPALDSFPFRLWERLQRKQGRSPALQRLSALETPGFRPLREAIAGHLAAARGVRCTWEQVFILHGSQQALALAARTLLNDGEAVWMEDPGYLGARAVFLSVGARLIPVPVDQEGLNVPEGVARCTNARAVFVTPSHQFPLGVALSLSRRLQLLEWARQANAWIFEDDYDSEFRYEGRPLPALQGLDEAGRVLYFGTFSKSLFPALRLGYVVVPAALVEAFARVGLWTHLPASLSEQALVADFISEGHFSRHLRGCERFTRRDKPFSVRRHQSRNWNCLFPRPTPGFTCWAGYQKAGTTPLFPSRPPAGAFSSLPCPPFRWSRCHAAPYCWAMPPLTKKRFERVSPP